MNLRRFKCDRCSYVATRKYMLRDHLFASHDVGEGRKCKECNYVTASTGNLSVHVTKCHRAGIENSKVGKGLLSGEIYFQTVQG